MRANDPAEDAARAVPRCVARTKAANLGPWLPPQNRARRRLVPSSRASRGGWRGYPPVNESA